MTQGPSPLRIGAACLGGTLAAVAPSLLLGPIGFYFLPYTLMIAGGHMLVLGLPTYLVMRTRQRVDWNQALIAGLLVGAIPLAALQLLFNAMLGYLGVSLVSALICGTLGMIAGAVFRAIVGPPAERAAPDDTAAIFS